MAQYSGIFTLSQASQAIKDNNWTGLPPQNVEYLIVAGGAKTYVKLLPYIKEFYVTHVNGTYDGDTFMPPFEDLFTQQEVVKEFDGHKVVKYSK